MKDRRIGKFYVDYDCVVEGDIKDTLAKMKFVPLRVEMLVEKMQFEYVGISPLFDNCKIGQTTPIYTILVNNLGHDISISVKKK